MLRGAMVLYPVVIVNDFGVSAGWESAGEPYFDVRYCARPRRVTDQKSGALSQSP